jgi:hypothetical protein
MNINWKAVKIVILVWLILALFLLSVNLLGAKVITVILAVFVSIGLYYCADEITS